MSNGTMHLKEKRQITTKRHARKGLFTLHSLFKSMFFLLLQTTIKKLEKKLNKKIEKKNPKNKQKKKK